MPLIKLETRHSTDQDTFTCSTCKYIVKPTNVYQLCGELHNQAPEQPLGNATVDPQNNYCELYEISPGD